jgi:alkylation response protein AidB-like acyl-CoA dehydrogenase
VLEKSNVAGTALLPLVGLLDELEELGAHLEGLFLILLERLGLDLLRQLDDGFEVDIFRLGGFFLLRWPPLVQNGRGPLRHCVRAYLVIALCGGGSFTVGLGAARVVAAILVIFLLLLLGASAKHGEDR